MSWDIYGRELRRGYCEVHPNVREGYPCSVCQAETEHYRAMEEAAYYASLAQGQPEPCQDCYYATGQMQDCDGTCRTLPYPEWDYFKANPDQTPPDLLPTMIREGEQP